MDCTPTCDVFHGILWPDGEEAGQQVDEVAEPDCFHDLNLDQVVAAINTAWAGERLSCFFRVPLQSVETITWRQGVLRDLEEASLRQAVTAFVERLRDMHVRLGSRDKLYYPIEKQRAHLGAVHVYCEAVKALAGTLERLQPNSDGLQRLRHWLSAYTASVAFGKLRTDTENVLAALGKVRYDLLVLGSRVTVRTYADEVDASIAVKATFAKFRPDAGGDAQPSPHGSIGLGSINHIEAQVLDKIAMLQPEPFAMLATFRAEHGEFVDATLDRFAREVCFYLAWLAHIVPLQATHLAFCFPAVDPDSRGIEANDAFDVALATKQAKDNQRVVCNDFALRGEERLLVVTGPNHGGKTTFARMFGQLHWLAALGLTVPGTKVRRALFDQLFTHFERAESVETLRGKLKDDLVRIRAILDHATPRSLIVMNEIFSSTTLEDALSLAHHVLARITHQGALAICVTFLTELAEFDAHTVSMVAEIDPHDPAIRTFKITRRPADGLAYALAVANKHQVTREWLLRRIKP